MYKDHLPHGVSACRFLLTALCILLFAGNLRAAGDEEYMRKKISVQAPTKASNKFWTKSANWLTSDSSTTTRFWISPEKSR